MFAAIWAAIGGIKGLFSFGSKIAEQIVQAKKDVLDAATEQDRIRAQERVSTLELIAQTVQQDRYASFVRAAFTLPYVVFIGKVVIWDKVLKWGVTDQLSTELWSVLWIILGYYFVRWLRNGT